MDVHIYCGNFVAMGMCFPSHRICTRSWSVGAKSIIRKGRVLYLHKHNRIDSSQLEWKYKYWEVDLKGRLGQHNNNNNNNQEEYEKTRTNNNNNKSEKNSEEGMGRAAAAAAQECYTICF